MKEIIAAVVAEVDGVVIEVETMPDHVHLLVEVPLQWSPSRLISTVGGASLGVVRRSVENQQVVAARKRAG